ncbi:GNAT family N-acetyltransferase [Candidatus Laterigemmans baculatus]|uniref:GNAT family N-acetyltransferase n=1 Tax=Candidatus Laterigemmans baculatus TaxID=2770505 RepID=UPI0013DA1E93|nr:GNAT family N-acetyltransferase [Candidatus Laterigemmans baculatus]
MVTLRLATESDLPAIAAILNREIAETVNCFRTRPLSPADAEQWWRARENGRYPAWVAEIDAEVVGWASLSRWSAYEAYDGTAEVSVWVLPVAQRQGLGKRFFRELLAFATAAEFRVLLSRIEAENQPSLRLHEQFGFTPVGTMHNVGEKFGRLLDVVIMERQLP